MTYRLTNKRKKILDILQASNKPLSAGEIYEKLPEIDLVTIYRALELFTSEGLLKKLQLGDQALFEYQQQPHHHVVCTDCDRLIHIELSERELQKLIPLRNFLVADVTITGSCCTRK
jgi:Fe2+ or Zn2+ uptake regulation protein